MTRYGHRRWQRGTLTATRSHWVLRLRRDNEDGKRREERIRIGLRADLRTRREARAAADRVADQATGRRIAAGSVIDAQAWLARYRLERLPLMRESTRASMASIISRHLEPLVSGRRLDELTGEHVQSMIGRLAAAGLAPASVRAVVRVLRVVLRAAQSSGFACHPLDTRALQFPARRRVSSAPSTFTAAELRRLRTEPPLPWRLVYAIAAGLGLRCGEVLGLAWSHVDLERGHVEIRQAAVRGRVAPLKTAGSAGTLPLSAELARLLADYRATWMPNPHGLLFATRNGKPYHASALWRRLRTDLRRLGLAPRGTHAFRHSAASALLASGLSPAAVRDFLRHSDVRVTDLYSHAVRDDLRRGAETLSPLMAEAAPAVPGTALGGMRQA